MGNAGSALLDVSTGSVGSSSPRGSLRPALNGFLPIDLAHGPVSSPVSLITGVLEVLKSISSAFGLEYNGVVGNDDFFGIKDP
jgi:hypothetical protein